MGCSRTEWQEQSNTNQSRAEQSNAEQSRADQSRQTEKSRARQSRAQQSKTVQNKRSRAEQMHSRFLTKVSRKCGNSKNRISETNHTSIEPRELHNHSQRHADRETPEAVAERSAPHPITQDKCHQGGQDVPVLHRENGSSTGREPCEPPKFKPIVESASYTDSDLSHNPWKHICAWIPA